MSLEVHLTVKAQRQMKRAARWWAKHRSPQQAERWAKGFYEAMNRLAVRPEERPLARENEAFPVTLRELRYGLGRRPTHRAVFIVRPNGVFIYAIRHLAQADLSPKDL